MTDTERFAWQRLRYRQIEGHRFRRQVPIGPFIADFVCLERRLILELDGGQHAEQVEKDTARTKWFESQGFVVLRFWNNEVLQNWDAVEQVIWEHLQRLTPHPNPPPQGGRE
jgi:very-short-patch-repair endonuclease